MASKDSSKKEKSTPKVPIQTYKWEDVRRSRRKGGYPWTYLDKDPFDEKLYNVRDFKMERLRKNKTAKHKSSEAQKIPDITNGVEEIDTTDMTQFMEDNFPLKPSFETMHDVVKEKLKDFEPTEAVESVTGSSDNISLYLDKEERGPVTQCEEQDQSTETLGGPSLLEEDAHSVTPKPNERAKSEEPKRKRKLSVESSYSRISLSKLGVLKKLKNAKDKIKLSNIRKHSAKKEEPKNKEPVEKSVVTKPAKHSRNEKPMYIHIPLKPPEGETDEFSYLEFGEKKPIIQEEIPKLEVQEEEEEEEKNKEKEAIERYSPYSEKKNAFPLSLALPTLGNKLAPPKDDKDNLSAIIFLGGDDDDSTEDYNIMVIDVDDTTQDMTIEEVTNTDLRRQVLESIKKAESQGDISSIKTSLSRTSSKNSVRKTRAKSAEPEKKRRSSIDSSYSRKSLSKLSFLEKLKNAKNLLGFAKGGSKSSLKQEVAKTKTKSEEQPIVKEASNDKTTTLPKKSKKSEAKYIHIPLKPPPGETDEFSYLEFENQQIQPTTSKASPAPQESIESPKSDDQNQVQFIFLTPPSDDEILDDKHDVPETPLSETETFFSNKVGELKDLAKDVVDKYSPETTRKKLSTVIEDIESMKSSQNETAQSSQIEDESKMIIDEEDGLQSSPNKNGVNNQDNQVLKSSLKGDSTPKGTESPVLKKKVSFKRRKTVDKEYEEIKQPSEKNETDDQKTIAVLENEKSMSVDEEKTYLDEKIVKTTSLDEDYNKWSKLSDHEYEPVNPPPDNTAPTVPSVSVTDSKQLQIDEQSKLNSNPASDFEENAHNHLSAQEMQSEIENRFFGASAQAKRASTSPAKRTGSFRAKRKSETPPGDKDKPAEPNRFQVAFKTQTDKFKSKIKSIKKPTINLHKPTFSRPNIKRPKLSFPKIPDSATIHLPAFSFPRPKLSKNASQRRQDSTESNAGDSKTHIFDFKTYPRIFKRNRKNEQDSFDSKDAEPPSFATVPRTKRKNSNNEKNKSDRWSGSDSIRIPLHSEDSMENGNGNEYHFENGASHRYDENIDMDDAYEKENREINTAVPSKTIPSRWDHGSFHPEANQDFDIAHNHEVKVTDLDQPDDPIIESSQSKDAHSSVSSGMHRGGVLEEIDSDEFFLRQKGISQDNIEVGRYLSSEIREAFRPPVNTLSQFGGYGYENGYDLRASNQSLPETKRKPMKKPKRKKTPHVSQERVVYSVESDIDDYKPEPAPSRPKRKSKKSKTAKADKDVIPFQETIHVDNIIDETDKIEIHNVKAEKFDLEQLLYEPEIEEDIEKNMLVLQKLRQQLLAGADSFEEEEPERPPRQRKSLRSLNYSEHDSILDHKFHFQNDYRTSLDEKPVRPARSRTRSISQENYSIDSSSTLNTLPPKPPKRNRSRTRSHSRAASQPDINDEQQPEYKNMYEEQTPCLEEVCVKDIRDAMGYATVGKQAPEASHSCCPPATPPRSRKSSKGASDKFATVPRSTNELPPIRPKRNYSTLGPSRPPRRPVPNLTDEEKENIDIFQYIEIDENRDLESGEVIEKVQNRPLPAPPRPPRKTRTLHDIASESNKSPTNEISTGIEIEEIEISTQTEPLPDDFVCEELIHNDNDKIIIPSNHRVEDQETPKPKALTVETKLITPTHYTYEETITHGSLIVEPLDDAQILPDSELIRKKRSTERIVPIEKEYDETEFSEVPEDFHKLEDPVQKFPSTHEIRSTSSLSPTFEVVKTQKLQVTDLDVDRLTVNELMANKIVVSEIDSHNIHAVEIGSKTGVLKIGEIEIPPNVVQQILERLQESIQEDEASSVRSQTETSTLKAAKSDENVGQKKTSIEQVPAQEYLSELQTSFNQTLSSNSEIDSDETPEVIETIVFTSTPGDLEQLPEEITSIENKPKIEDTADIHIEEQYDQQNLSLDDSPNQSNYENIPSLETPEEPTPVPTRPPRHSIKRRPDRHKATEDNEEIENTVSSLPDEPEVDDEPPPRPPQPPFDYIPSQPPASFYALRAQKYVDNIHDDHSSLPRRKRHHKPRISTSSESSSPIPRRRYHSPEASIPQLTGQLMRACSTASNRAIKRLISHFSKNVLRNEDGKQDSHVVILILLVLIAGLILLTTNGGKTVHVHHWEYFNPPRDL